MASQRNPSSSLVPFQSGNDPPDPDPLPHIVASLQDLCLTPPKGATVQLKYSPEVAQLEANHNMLLKVGLLGWPDQSHPLGAAEKSFEQGIG